MTDKELQDSIDAVEMNGAIISNPDTLLTTGHQALVSTHYELIKLAKAMAESLKNG